MKYFHLMIMLVMLLSGCAHVLSDHARNSANTSINLQSLFENPNSYRGAIVILGGIIANVENRQEGTYIEAVQQPLDYRGRPIPSSKTLGRFIVFHNQYLDPLIFSEGRYVALAGEIIGTRIKPLGETEYPYLTIRSVELQLVDPKKGMPVHFGVGISTSF